MLGDLVFDFMAGPAEGVKVLEADAWAKAAPPTDQAGASVVDRSAFVEGASEFIYA